MALTFREWLSCIFRFLTWYAELTCLFFRHVNSRLNIKNLKILHRYPHSESITQNRYDRFTSRYVFCVKLFGAVTSSCRSNDRTCVLYMHTQSLRMEWSIKNKLISSLITSSSLKYPFTLKLPPVKLWLSFGRFWTLLTLGAVCCNPQCKNYP